jgi:hypothetical protein
VLNFSTLSALGFFFFAIAMAASVVEIWAFVDALSRPERAFVATGKQTKPRWLLITGVAAVVGFGSAILSGGLAVIGILPVASFVAAAIYLTDVRPKVKAIGKGGGGGSSYGPYGPW